MVTHYLCIIFNTDETLQNDNLVKAIISHFQILKLTAVCFLYSHSLYYSVADAGFPVGGAPTRWGGRQPPMRTLFGKNVCENERN